MVDVRRARRRRVRDHGSSRWAQFVILTLPFRGTWLARNSPARRVPSHGTDLFATTYAIDFIAVKGRRTPTTRDWRTLLATEPVERFFAFGQASLTPASGRVVASHDGEMDHSARRSQTSLVPYALREAARARQRAGALAGDHVIVELDQGGYVLLAHLRAGSLRVDVGTRVVSGGSGKRTGVDPFQRYRPLSADHHSTPVTGSTSTRTAPAGESGARLQAPSSSR
jgi:hypothetical protein